MKLCPQCKYRLTPNKENIFFHKYPQKDESEFEKDKKEYESKAQNCPLNYVGININSLVHIGKYKEKKFISYKKYLVDFEKRRQESISGYWQQFLLTYLCEEYPVLIYKELDVYIKVNEENVEFYLNLPKWSKSAQDSKTKSANFGFITPEEMKIQLRKTLIKMIFGETKLEEI